MVTLIILIMFFKSRYKENNYFTNEIYSYIDIGSNDIAINSTNVLSNINLNHAVGMNWDRYHRLETIYDYLLQMEALHPDLAKVGYNQMLKIGFVYSVLKLQATK